MATERFERDAPIGVIADTPCDAVLRGHSHKARHEWRDGRLLFNPDETALRGAILHLPL